MKKYRILALACCVLAACGSNDGTVDSPSTSSTVAADGYVVPPQGAQRIKLTMMAFELAPGAEVYKCQNFPNPFGKDVAILQSQASISAGSHHLLVFRSDQNENGALEDCSGLEFHQSLHTAQTPMSRTTYPAGVGASYIGTDGIRLNAHYLNLSGQPIQPRIEVVLDSVEPTAVRELAAPIYLNDATISIPPGAGKGGGTLSTPPEAGIIKLISVQSHMHRHMVHFTLSVNGSAPLYETDSWNEPPVKLFSPELTLNPGASLSWRCDCQNDTTSTLTFGESAATNEMCTLTGYYYPAPQGMALVGDIALAKMWLAR